VIARAAASVIVAGALVLGASGCSFIAPQATLIHYEPSDGTAATIGDVKARNVIALSEDGTSANLILTLVNDSNKPQVVNFQYEDAAGAKSNASVSVQRNSSTPVGYNEDDKSVTLAGIDVTVGSLIPVYLQYGDEEGKLMLVPVLDGAQPQFATLTPADAAE
jgi:sugar lactone lactonase YvrE